MPEIFNTIFGRPQHDSTHSDGTDVAVVEETSGANTIEVAPAASVAVEATEEDTAGHDVAEESDDATDAGDEDQGDDETVADEADVEESEEDAADDADAEETDDTTDEADTEEADDATDEADTEDDADEDLADDVEESDDDATDAAPEVADEDGESAEDIEAAQDDDATVADETDADDAEPVVEPVVVVPVTDTRAAANTRGSISVGDGVVAKVVNIVARKVDGVHSLDAEGTSVGVDDDVATITVSIVVEYGHAIKPLAEQIRTDVIEAVEQFLGLDVAAVDVHVSDIHAPAAD